MLEPFGPSLYVAEGPTVSFFGFPYPTRIAVVRLGDGSLWVWSPIALTPALIDTVHPLHDTASMPPTAVERIHHAARMARGESLDQSVYLDTDLGLIDLAGVPRWAAMQSFP